jgi:hypothetical protein
MKYKTFNSRVRLAKSIKLAYKIFPDQDIMELKPFEIEEAIYNIIASPNPKVKDYFEKWNIKYSRAINTLKII